MGKKVCIIGAGISGLTTIKACIEENLKPDCFELCSNIGGLWLGQEYCEKMPLAAHLYDSLIVNVSKDFVCFSDFPFLPNDPHYPTSQQFLEYFTRYAEKFDLLNCINFNTRVEHVAENTTQGWTVVVKDLTTEQTSRLNYDCVIVCSEKHGRALIPNIPGLHQSTFNGEIIHAQAYRIGDYSDKNVIVIGAGNTGTDVAVEISKTASSVVLCSRSGSFNLPRYMKKGVPVLYSRTRVGEWLMSMLPNFISDKIKRRMMEQYLPAKYGLQSNREPSDMATNFVINDEVRRAIRTGKILAKRSISYFDGNTCHFADGSLFQADCVVYATGYLPSHPFINHIFPEKPSQLKLYKWIFPINIAHVGSLAAVGFMPESLEGLPPVCEAQARLVALVISSKIKLPTEVVMKREFLNRTEPFVYKMPPTLYRDEILAMIGAKPSILCMIFKDPYLAYKYLFGPMTSHYARLQGPHSWTGARAAIMGSSL